MKRAGGVWSAGPVERAGRRGRRRAIILTVRDSQRELVARRCEVAASCGLREGMDLAHARSLLSSHVEAVVLEHKPEADAWALRGLARWALRFSPVCSWEGDDGLVIDTTGTELVHGGEGRLLRRIARSVRGLGFETARVAAASTVGCAWAVSRYGRHALSRVPAGREREAIEGLGIDSLRVAPGVVRGFAEIGITTVGELLRLPRSSIAARFDGDDGERPGVLRRLQQALGEVDEYIDPVRPVTPIEHSIVFDGPTDRWESVEAACREAVDGLAKELARRERGVRVLSVELARAYAARCVHEITLSRPSRSGRHLWSMVRSRLEGVDLAGLGGDGTGNVSGGVEAITVRAVRSERLRHEQACHEGMGGESHEHREEESWGELTDALVGRLGADNVVLMQTVESHVPERAFCSRSVMEAVQRGRPGEVMAAWRWRPPVLFERPEAATAMALTPDGPVMSIGWRGRRWSVEWCSMAERVGGEWWAKTEAEVSRCRGAEEKSTRAAQEHRGLEGPGPTERSGGTEGSGERDYFVVKTVEQGRVLWVYRSAASGRWFVHGEWS